MTKTIHVNHLARVEGHGGIRIELDGNTVSSVQFQAFEGARLVEGLLAGRRYEDVAAIVSRVCAICSTAHTLTSLKATEEALGIEVTEQTVALRNLMFLGENIESHALHLFLLAAPDYLGYPGAGAMATDFRDTIATGLRLKKLGNTVQEAIGGRAVHPVNAVLGGFAALPRLDTLIRLRDDLRAGLRDAAAAIDFLASLPDIDCGQVDCCFAAKHAGDGPSYYTGTEITIAGRDGSKRFDVTDYRSVFDETTVPYSHAKLNRRDGKPFMVGALARLVIHPRRLTGRSRRAAEKLGLSVPSGNPLDNNKAQAVELVLDIEQAALMVDRILDVGLTEEPRKRVESRPGRATAVTEAPRGLLIHSYTYDGEGRIAAADIVTPTAMNAASIEQHLRQAVMESTDRSREVLTRKLEMVARAYDPCISCAVHVVSGK